MLLSWRRVCAEDGQINRAAVEIFICFCWLEGWRLRGGGVWARMALLPDLPEMEVGHASSGPVGPNLFCHRCQLLPPAFWPWAFASLWGRKKKGANFMSASFNKWIYNRATPKCLAFKFKFLATQTAEILALLQDDLRGTRRRIHRYRARKCSHR